MNTLHPIGVLKTIEAPCSYIQDSLGLFQQISADSDHHLLFDSAEIESKEHLKSLLLVDACLKLTCHGLVVTLDALTDNGKDLTHLHCTKIFNTAHYWSNTKQITTHFPTIRY